MADIRAYPFLRHLRAEPTSHVSAYRAGALRKAGTGLAIWFRAMNTAIVEVPIDDRELPFLFRVRSRDFQELVVQGVITFRVVDPALLARRVDFSIDLDTGRWTQAPLDQVGGLITQLAQQFVIDELVRLDLRAILAEGVAPVRDRIAAGLVGEGALGDLGLEVVAVRVAALTSTSDVEQALQQPTREAIQQRADEAVFERRALAVESERAIADNELKNRIELARREEDLVVREGANARRRAQEDAAAALVAARAADERAELGAEREAASLDTIESARLRALAEEARIQSAMPADVLMALALRELAGQLDKVEHLTLTPDLLTPLLTRLGSAPRAQG